MVKLPLGLVGSVRCHLLYAFLCASFLKHGSRRFRQVWGTLSPQLRFERCQLRLNILGGPLIRDP